MYRIFDRCINHTYWADDRDELAEVLSSMFDTEEPGVSEAIAGICKGIGHDYTGDWEQFLNIEISVASCRDCSKFPGCAVGRTRAREHRMPCIDFTMREET